MKRLALATALLTAALPLSAAVVVVNTTVNVTVPDDRSTGLFSQATVSVVGTVTSVAVGFDLGATSGSQAFVGDLYAYLQHDSGISVLLNRPGKRAGESLGYDDNQSLAVTFDDSGAGDIHNYRAVDTTPLSGPLTGTWIPDGRTSDPASVLASQSPTALLSVFNGAPSQGVWRFFLADLSGGAIHQFDSWSLTLNYTPVPEPATWAAVTATGLLAFAASRRLRRSGR